MINRLNSINLPAVSRQLNSAKKGVYSIANGTLYGCQPACMCSACRSSRSSSRPQTLNFVNNQPNSKVPPNSNAQDEDTGEEEKIDPQLHALIPDAEYVKNDPTIQAVGRVALPFLNEKDAQMAISPDALQIGADNKKLREVITEVDKDIAEAKVNRQQLIFARDERKHAFIEIVNRTGTPLTLSKAIELVVSKKPTSKEDLDNNAYISGVEIHEIEHAEALKRIPDVKLEEFEQGVRIVITGTAENPQFEITTFGQTVFYADKIYDKTDQNEQAFNNAQQQFQQGLKNGFKGWSEDTFIKLINGLKKNLNSLKYLAQEAYTLGMAAIAPKALEGTVYYEHAVLSAADEKRYGEAIQLKDYIDRLMDKIQAFINQAAQIWSSKTSGTQQAANNNAANNIVKLQRQPVNA